MKKKLKITIYSGTIPSTTFIENLIEVIALKHTVLLFGRNKRKVQYSNTNIRIFSYSESTLVNLIQALFRTLLLVVRFPKRSRFLWFHIRKQKSSYQKRETWIRTVPVLLNKPAIFHIQWAKDLDNWLFLQQLEVKIVVSLRGAHINYSPIADAELANSYKMNFPKVDAFHAVSDAIALEAQKYNASVENIRVIHSIVSQSTFDLFRLPEKRNEAVLRIISVGRHHWKKGYATALDACKILKEKNIPFVYTIVAQGKVPEELLVQRHELDLSDEIVFKENIPQAKLFETMQDNDVLLLPSLEEGIANVVLESMAIGVPVISSDCGGMSEIVIPNKTGWLVPILDADAMIEALITFKVTSMEINKIMILNAQALVKTKFDSKENQQKFIELYHGLYNFK